jgi:hypothetical protein
MMAGMIDKLKKAVSSGSAAGKLRDADKKRQEMLKSMGAKAGRTSAKPKAKTRLA